MVHETLTGEDSELGQTEQLRHDLEAVQGFAEQLGVDLQTLQTVFQVRTLIEVQNVDVGGGTTVVGGGGAGGVGSLGTLKAFEFSTQAGADTDILQDDFSVDQRVAVLRTTIAIDAGGTDSVLSLVLDSGGDENIVDFNQSTALPAGTLWSFDVPVSEDLEINYRIDQQTTVAVLVAQEIDTAGP